MNILNVFLAFSYISQIAWLFLSKNEVKANYFKLYPMRECVLGPFYDSDVRDVIDDDYGFTIIPKELEREICAATEGETYHSC